MNRADLVREILRWESIAAAATAKAKELRSDLAAQAVAEFTEQGVAPSWSIPGLGTAVLPVSKASIQVTDPDALTKWAKVHHPDRVETVDQVRPGAVEAIVSTLIADEAGVVDPETGELVPGLTIREGGKPGALTLRLERAAKKSAAGDAAEVLSALTVSGEQHEATGNARVEGRMARFRADGAA